MGQATARIGPMAVGQNVAYYYSFISQISGFVIHLNIQEIQLNSQNFVENHINIKNTK
jgi:hypothetical protein